MKTSLAYSLIALLFAITLLSAIVAYPYLPEQVVSHWDAQGNADGSSGKATILILPMMLLLFGVIAYVIPKIDPLKANIESFRPYYNLLWVMVSLFFFVIFLLMLSWNLGYPIPFERAMGILVASLWLMLGIVLPKAKRNWFVGIRSPWTLSSDRVWEKTHALGGALFKIAAVIALIGVLIPSQTLFFAVVPAVLIAAITLVYSYVVYQREQTL